MSEIRSLTLATGLRTPALLPRNAWVQGGERVAALSLDPRSPRGHPCH